MRIIGFYFTLLKKKGVKSPIIYNMEKSGIPNLTRKQNQH